MAAKPRRLHSLEVDSLRPSHPNQTVADAAREQWGRIFSVLVAQFRDWELAEDALQDAYVAALERWPDDGIPSSPRAWLLSTARRKAIDVLRRAKRFEHKRQLIGLIQDLEPFAFGDDELDDVIGDERLRLIFTCCHPALSEDAQVALTLRTLGGLQTSEIARAFLVPEATMAQRLVRAKRKIRVAGIPYVVPPKALWRERLASVLAVIYLIFNEGYAASSGESSMRPDLCTEAVRLGETLLELTDSEPEVTGLVALMLIHDARREARCGPEGEAITLEFQDRGRWQQSKIHRGQRLLEAALQRKRPGPYQIQAAISELHAAAASFENTDWVQIALLYRSLHEITGSDVVKLNWTVAVSFASGPQRALGLLEEIEQAGELADYQPFFATKADLLRRLGDLEGAAEAYGRAIALSRNRSERQLLSERLERLQLSH